MADDFNELKIDGAVIREIVFVPSRSVRMSVLRAPETESERQVTTQHSLDFQGIHCCTFKFDANPWLEIESHYTLSSSDYLEQRLQFLSSKVQSSDTQPEIFHFQIILDEGQIDILAERFTSSVEEEMPHLGPSEAVT